MSQGKAQIAVLMATHNGMPWLAEQMETILQQRDVEVVVFVSDDNSHDSTCEWLTKMALTEPRIRLLPFGGKFGSAGKNFYRLIREVDITPFDYVAYADQDDLWHLDKLVRHVHLLEQHQVDAVSSDVIAFWQDGRTQTIVKSQPQKLLDYVFESSGPGCSFLMTPALVAEIKSRLLDDLSPASNVTLHDWLSYAVCRASGRRWLIDNQPTLQYRQHGQNVVGANHGWSAKLVRLKKLRQGWYRSEIIKVAKVCHELSDDERYVRIAELFSDTGYWSRFGLIRYAIIGRRKRLDACLFSLAILSGLF